jgi:hypothetical protein
VLEQASVQERLGGASIQNGWPCDVSEHVLAKQPETMYSPEVEHTVAVGVPVAVAPGAQAMPVTLKDPPANVSVALLKS